MAALRMPILTLLAVCTWKVTGIRFLQLMPRRLMAEIPAWQLWHPVSAIAESDGCNLLCHGEPKSL